MVTKDARFKQTPLLVSYRSLAYDTEDEHDATTHDLWQPATIGIYGVRPRTLQ